MSHVAHINEFMSHTQIPSVKMTGSVMTSIVMGHMYSGGTVTPKSALQCVAVCCSVLQCVSVCCSALQCVALCCRVFAVCCSVLQCVVACCSVLQCVAVCCSVL